LLKSFLAFEQTMRRFPLGCFGFIMYLVLAIVESCACQLYIKLESNHSSQVPPPRQCYSLGGVTIFALPVVLLMPPLTQW